MRVVIPKLYFWKSAKWLRANTFTDKDSPGYWEPRGYHDEGNPWKADRSPARPPVNAPRQGAGRP